MTDTSQLGLPLLAASQAQKHVTVNEALMRLDGLVQLVLQSVTLAAPPAAPGDGAAWGVPAGATGAWAGKAGQVALATGGGWEFVPPRPGWRAFVRDAGAEALWSGEDWRVGQLTLSPHGAGLVAAVIEIDHAVTAGAVSTTAAVIPANAVVIGVTARVLTAITGTLTGWQLGNPGAAGRYGTGLGLGAGSYARGVLGQPTAFYSAEALQLDAEGGAFAGGTVRIAVHCLTLSLPSA